MVDDAGRHIGLETFGKLARRFARAALRHFIDGASDGRRAQRCTSSRERLRRALLSERGPRSLVAPRRTRKLANLGEALPQHRRHNAAIAVREREKMKAMALTICNDSR